MAAMGVLLVVGILAALEPVFDEAVVTHNGSPRAMDVEALALRAEERFGPERVVTAATLKLFPIMRSRAVAVVGLETAAASVELLLFAVPDAELAARRARQDELGWKPAEERPRKITAALRAYASMTTSAAKGAVRNI